MLRRVDLLYALRLLRKSPWFTLTTIAVLAGGLAISIYTWSVLNTMVYKDLPIADGHAVVRVVGTREGRFRMIDAFTLAQMRPRLSQLDEVGAYRVGSVLVGGVDASRSVAATYAQWNMFHFTRTAPLLGRGFVKADAIDGAERVAVLSYRIWQAVFAGDRQVVGQVVRIDRQPTRIIGVMPAGYAFPVAADMWLPLTTRQLNPTAYGEATLIVYARLRGGVSMHAADRHLQQLLQSVQRQYPQNADDPNRLDGMRVATFQMAQTDAQGGMLFVVLNTVSLFILLLACVNVGNMLLARTNERVREIAVRVALGAPRWRLTGQMMLESAIICVVGGALALALAGWALHATNRFMNSNFEGNLPFWWRWGLDAGTVSAAAVFVVITVALVSALPTFSATAVEPNALLRDGTRGARGRRSGRVSRALVTLQIVLVSMVMVIGSAMALIAWRAAHIDFGLDARHLLRLPLDLDGSAWRTPEQQLPMYRQVLEGLKRDASVADAMVETGMGKVRFALDAVTYATPDDYPTAALIVSSQGTAPLGQKLLQGRYFDRRDSASGLHTVVISEFLAQAFWPHDSALGQRLRIVRDGKAEPARIVVGVVSDVRRGENLFSTDKTTYAALYVPLAQSMLASVNILVRHRGSEATARTALYRSVQQTNATLTPGAIVSYTEIQHKLTLMATSLTELFVRCGLFAILLGLTGIYGLSSNAVIQRMHEIGLRRAIGARDSAIVRLFLRQGARQLLTSLAISALLATGALYLVAQFTGISGWTLLAVGGLVAAVVAVLVLGSIWLATRRSLRHEPSVALRHE